jgi:hypothetical protein
VYAPYLSWIRSKYQKRNAFSKVRIVLSGIWYQNPLKTDCLMANLYKGEIK